MTTDASAEPFASARDAFGFLFFSLFVNRGGFGRYVRTCVVISKTRNTYYERISFIYRDFAVNVYATTRMPASPSTRYRALGLPAGSSQRATKDVPNPPRPWKFFFM
jgi:hypothetical protein